jgi:hypothetical protein
VAFVKENFGMTLSNQAFSTLKSQLKSGGRKPAKPQPKPAQAKPAATPANGKYHGNPAELARAVKALVHQHGAEAVVEMAKVFAD